jgi:uncharacterized protein YjbI with pentapeptide repeats
MQGAFFRRSLIEKSSFAGTNLTGASLTWNDFDQVVFTAAVLCEADLRCSQFERCSFENADLSGADLRLSQFLDCQFTGANMCGAKLTREQSDVAISPDQSAMVDWQAEPGEEPEGG